VSGSLMFVACNCLCCHVEVSATARSLVHRSSTDYGVCLSVITCKQTTPTPNVSTQKRSGVRYDFRSTGLFHTNHSHLGHSNHGHCISSYGYVHLTCG
jgi:hypothetical protein